MDRKSLWLRWKKAERELELLKIYVQNDVPISGGDIADFNIEIAKFEESYSRIKAYTKSYLKEKLKED